ncbi:hypothetical protein CRU92_00820 [Arcobacter sp. FW59]|nr:hypothetical protein CRU92_00820 [Arcobacter sp. FW59]
MLNKSKKNYVLVVGLEKYNVDEIKSISKEFGIDYLKIEDKKLFFPKVFEEFKYKFETKFITTSEYYKKYFKDINEELMLCPNIFFISNGKANFFFGDDNSEELLREKCNLFVSQIISKNT